MEVKMFKNNASSHRVNNINTKFAEYILENR